MCVSVCACVCVVYVCACCHLSHTVMACLFFFPLVFQGGSHWKSMRSQIITCVDSLLNHLVHAPNPATELFNLCASLYNPSSPCQCQAARTRESEHLHCIAKPSGVDLALWERFVSSIHDSLKVTSASRNGRAQSLCSWLVLIDDNMQYSSMRYEYCQLARKCEC